MAARVVGRWTITALGCRPLFRALRSVLMQGTIAWALGISRWAVTERPKQPAHGAQEAFLALLALYLAAVRGGGLQFGRLLCRERGVHAAEATEAGGLPGQGGPGGHGAMAGGLGEVRGIAGAAL